MVLTECFFFYPGPRRNPIHLDAAKKLDRMWHEVPARSVPPIPGPGLKGHTEKRPPFTTVVVASITAGLRIFLSFYSWMAMTKSLCLSIRTTSQVFREGSPDILSSRPGASSIYLRERDMPGV